MESLKLTHCKPARPGATGCGYTTVLTAYECLTFHHRILPCQVWARGLGQGHKKLTIELGDLVSWWQKRILLT